MVKLKEDYINHPEKFKEAGVKIPAYDQREIIRQTEKNPVWVHFGGGNLFRSFHSRIAQKLLNQGKLKSGIILVETRDNEVVKKIYQDFYNRFLSVVMKSDGSLDKKLIASTAQAFYLSRDFPWAWNQLTNIFTKPSLQLVTFSFTEKGYALTDSSGKLTLPAQMDIQNGPYSPVTNMGIVAHLLYARFKAGQLPIAMVSTDNFSQNGKELQTEVLKIAKGWQKNRLVEDEFIDYLTNPKKVSFPWTMIDRITPNPSKSVGKKLSQEGFSDTHFIHTAKHTNLAPFANTEETHYLVMEDSFPNGRPPLEKAGVIMTDRNTVNKADQMKVTACLNPLHTALAIYGNLLGYHSIAKEVSDPDLLGLIKNLGYGEDLPVVLDPKVISPKKFIDQLVTKRLPNKNIPDTPQRIAADTSQKIPIRYGVTIQHYIDDPNRSPKQLEFIPLVIAGWCRYLMGVDDQGKKFTPSPDPLYTKLHQKVSDIKLGQTTDVHAHLKDILSNATIFKNNLYKIGLGEKIENIFAKEIKGIGAVRSTIQETIKNKNLISPIKKGK